MIADALQEEKRRILRLLVQISNTTKNLQFLSISDYEISKDFKKRWDLKLNKFFSNIENYKRNEFPVVVLGRWNSGKSTLINAILGEEILPSANKEMTSILTKVCFGDARDAIVQYDGGDYQTVQVSEIGEYVNFRGNKYSDKIKQVDIRSNCAFLKSGLCILDTPGLSSINELNNKIAFDIIPKAHSIILTFSGSDVGGDDNLNLIEHIFRLNYDNLYNVVFVITKGDLLSEKDIKEAEESLKELISIARQRVEVMKDSEEYICIISSYMELKYQQYLKHEISENELLNDKKLGICDIGQLDMIHSKSNFEEFHKILDKSILNSENKKNITQRLFIFIQSVLTELLEDYNTIHRNILKSNSSSLKEISTLLEKKVTIETKINEDGLKIIEGFNDKIAELNPYKQYNVQKASKLINSIYMELCKYIEATPYEVIAKDEFRELNQQIELISTKLATDWMREIEKEFNSEWDSTIIKIARMIEANRKEIDDEFSQDNLDKVELTINGYQIKANSVVANYILSVASSASVGAGLFTIGNGIFPGVGGIIGSALGMFIGYVASRISLTTSGKRKEDLKKTLNKHLLDSEYTYRNALGELRLYYENKVKQLEEFLNISLQKVIHEKETYLKNYDMTKKKNKEIEGKLIADIKAIKELMPEINLAFSKIIRCED